MGQINLAELLNLAIKAILPLDINNGSRKTKKDIFNFIKNHRQTKLLFA